MYYIEYSGDLKFYHIYNFKLFPKIYLHGKLYRTIYMLKKDKDYYI